MAYDKLIEYKRYCYVHGVEKSLICNLLYKIKSASFFWIFNLKRNIYNLTGQIP